jgi:hypothetical protein
LAAFLGFSAVFYGPGELYYVVIPTLIATGSAMYASIGFVKVYQQTKRTTEKRKQRKTRLYVAVVLKRLVNAGWKRSISAPRKRTHWQAEEESRSKRAMHSSAQGDSET